MAQPRKKEISPHELPQLSSKSGGRRQIKCNFFDIVIVTLLFYVCGNSHTREINCHFSTRSDIILLGLRPLNDISI